MKRILPFLCSLLCASLALAAPVYVSNAGDDAKDGRAPETAVRSPARAMAIAQSGDVVHFRRGDTWADEIPIPREREELTLTDYGDEHLPRPKFTAAKVISTHEKYRYRAFTIEDLDFTAPSRGSGEGFVWRGFADELTIRRSNIQGYRINVLVEPRNAHVGVLTIEDSTILDSYAPSIETHTHGVYANFVDRLIFHRTLFDRNGWTVNDEGTIFNHALYINVGCGPVVFEDCVSSRNFADGGQFRTGGVVNGCIAIFNPIGYDVGAVKGGSDPIAGGIGLVFTNNIVGWCGDIRPGHPRSTGLRAGNYARLNMRDNWFLFGIGDDKGRHAAIVYDESDTNTIAEYEAVNNRHFGFKHALRDIAGAGVDFGLTALDAFPDRREAAVEWLELARTRWGEPGYTAADLRALLLAETPEQPNAPPDDDVSTPDPVPPDTGTETPTVGHVEIVATGSAPHIVLVNGEELSRHTTEAKAMQAAVNAAIKNPAATVRVVRFAEWRIQAKGGE